MNLSLKPNVKKLCSDIPFCLAISSPSGAGKTTICKKILQNYSNFENSVSATTRLPRNGEIDGKDYFFFNKLEFESKIKSNYFIEYAEVFGNLYGTPKSFILNKIQNGHNILFDIDHQGVKQIRDSLQAEPIFNFVSVFILPPSISELKTRLQKRGLDEDLVIQKRVQNAKFEISQSHSYDYILVNDDLELCISQIFDIINVTQMRYKKYDLSFLD